MAKDEMEIKVKVELNDMGIALLKNARDLLKNIDNSPLSDALSQTYMDGEVECDGLCLLDEIKGYLGEIDG